MLWNLIQQIQIGRAERNALSIEDRLTALEEQMERNSRVLIEVIRHLERRDGRDLDGDGRIG